jgi:pSer/pThr/pTyr-binding forkhead associated (FHA) protein
MTLRFLLTSMSNLLADSTSTNLIIGGLALLTVVIVVIALFWRIGRKSRVKAPTQPTQQLLSVEPTAATVPLPPPLPVEITLEFTAATGQPVSFKLDRPALTLGREPDNDIVISESILNADTVSKHHARLRRDQDDFIVRDLGSKNGLTVNGRQTLENLLQDGDHLSFGTAEAIFHRPLSNSSPAYNGGPGPGGAA